MSDRDRSSDLEEEFDLEEHFEQLHIEINQAKADKNLAFLVMLDAHLADAADSVRLGINRMKRKN